MLYPFISTGRNTKWIFDFQNKYQSMYLELNKKAENMRISPDYTQEEYFEALNESLACNYIYQSLVEIMRLQEIDDLKLGELKRSAESFNDLGLSVVLDNVFNFKVKENQISVQKQRASSSTLTYSRKASGLERRALQTAYLNRMMGSSEPVPSPEPGTITVRKSPHI